MSLQFSEDPLSKREKQERFKQSLDDQRRLKQEGMKEEQVSLASRKRDPNEGQFVPGLDGVSRGMSRIPGLDHCSYQDGGRLAPRFEGSASPPQEKQPYMSAVSDRRLLIPPGPICSYRMFGYKYEYTLRIT